MLTYVALYKCMLISWVDLLWLAVVVCSFISIPISYHLTTLHTDKFHIIRLPFVNRHIERSSTEQSCLFISIRFTLLEEVWIWDNWETLIYAFGRQGTELKVKFLCCNLTNLPCLCCLMENLAHFSINEALGVRRLRPSSELGYYQWD